MSPWGPNILISEEVRNRHTWPLVSISRDTHECQKGEGWTKARLQRTRGPVLMEE